MTFRQEHAQLISNIFTCILKFAPYRFYRKTEFYECKNERYFRTKLAIETSVVNVTEKIIFWSVRTLCDSSVSNKRMNNTMRKFKWVIEKEQAKKTASQETVWLFGTHAVRDALTNPAREKLRLITTKNAFDRLKSVIEQSQIEPEICDPRQFFAPLDVGSVHQGIALETKPLVWGNLEDHILGGDDGPARLVLLDQITDPHNVGAILRSAEVFGAQAVIGTQRHTSPETGALAKSASGALERQPYLRLRNLSDTIITLQNMGFLVLGLDGTADQSVDEVARAYADRPIALVFGAEGPGLRQRTKETVDMLVAVPCTRGFGSLNVSNAAAVALYAMRQS